MSRIAPLLFLLACGPKAPPVAAVSSEEAARATMPGPLAPRPFEAPAVQTARLSNGVELAVVENHEVPLVTVRLVLDAGAWLDPADRAGIASVTMDMLNEGAGDMDAAALSTRLRALATTLSSGAGVEGAAITMTCLRENLGPSLALMATVIESPTFPAGEWELMRKQRLQDLKAARENPASISARAWARINYGDWYEGHLHSEESYKSIDTTAMRAWWTTHGVPAQAHLQVSGDIQLAEATAMLEEHLGTWKGGSPLDEPAPTVDRLPSPDMHAIYLVDKPGAAQSFLKIGRFTGRLSDPDHFAFELANRAIGGGFTARINMNLREDKGWTYGARSSTEYDRLPGLWLVSTSVVTTATADSVSEILRELSESRAERPITEDELESARGYLLGTWPLRFEQPDFLLGQLTDIRRYGLPEDWISSWATQMRRVDLAQAQAAWNQRIPDDSLVILVVGDASVVRPGLEALGRPVHLLDADGRPLD